MERDRRHWEYENRNYDYEMAMDKGSEEKKANPSLSDVKKGNGEKNTTKQNKLCECNS